MEGMRPEVILDALRRAGATFEEETSAAPETGITKADLLELGIYGPGSGEKRAALIKKMGFPEKISTNAFLQAVNLLCTLEELTGIVASMENNNG